MKIMMTIINLILISGTITSLRLEYEKCPYQYNQTLRQELMDQMIKNNFFSAINLLPLQIACRNIKKKYSKSLNEYLCIHKINFSKNRIYSYPKISVVVPVYNTANYLKKCINSLINQTFNEIEIILIDDGSIDDSGNILDYYLNIDSRIIVIHQLNSGVSCTRNLGIDISRGEYIHFVDSDDYLNLKTYEYTYKYAKKDDIDALKINFRRFHYTNDNCDENDINLSDSPKEYFVNNPKISFYSCAYLYKLSLITENNVKFIHHLDIGEDTTFNYILAGAIKTIKNLPGTFYQYRISNPNQSTNRPLMILKYGSANHAGEINILKFVKDGWKNRGWIRSEPNFFLKVIMDLLENLSIINNVKYILFSLGEEFFSNSFLKNISSDTKHILNKILKMKLMEEGVKIEI